MAGLRFVLGFLCPLALVAAVFLIADGIKGDPRDLSQALEGALLFGFGLLCLPPKGHPMHRLSQRLSSKTPAHVQPMPRKPPLTPEAAQQLEEAVDLNLDALTFESRPRPWHAGRCRLDMVIGASVNATSWIGGLPEMPEDVDWPENDGRPMVFVAQIAINDLPPNVWDGLGPSEGWLLFFYEPTSYETVRVIHIDRKGPARPQPEIPNPTYRLTSEACDVVQGLGYNILTAGLQKWALRATPLAPDGPDSRSWDDRYKDKDDLRRTLWNPDLNAEPYRPDRHELVQALLGAVDVRLRDGQSYFRNPKPDTEEGRILAARYDTAFAELAHLRRQAEDGMAPEDLIAAADRISAGGADADNRIQPLWFGQDWRVTYRNMVEYLARETLHSDPAKLTSAERQIFEPVWERDAKNDALAVSGSSEGYVHTQLKEAALLLEFSPSELTGWSNSDSAPFAFFIKPEDLKAGRWENAWGDIIN